MCLPLCASCACCLQSVLAMLQPSSAMEHLAAGLAAALARLLQLLPTTSSALRAAPPMVVLQAYLKASIEQWENSELLANRGAGMELEVSVYSIVPLSNMHTCVQRQHDSMHLLTSNDKRGCLPILDRLPLDF